MTLLASGIAACPPNPLRQPPTSRLHRLPSRAGDERRARPGPAGGLANYCGLALPDRASVGFVAERPGPAFLVPACRGTAEHGHRVAGPAFRSPAPAAVGGPSWTSTPAAGGSLA